MSSKTLKKPAVDLSIVVPAYKEERRIGRTLDELADYLKHDVFFKGMNIEVLVVSADSTDKTHEIVESKKRLFKDLTLLKPGPKVGKGRDVRYGMLRAKGEAVVFMDADLATPLHHLPKFYASYKNGGQVVVATRNLRKHHPNLVRRMVSNGGNILFRFAGGVWIEDSQCGFKMFSQEASKICFELLNILGWGFDMEVLAIAKANHMKIQSHRINDWVAVPEGTFETSTMTNSITSLKELSIILRNRLTRKYKV